MRASSESTCTEIRLQGRRAHIYYYSYHTWLENREHLLWKTIWLVRQGSSYDAQDTPGISSIRFFPFRAIRSVLAKSKTTQAKTLRSHSSRKDRSSHSRIENSKCNRGALNSSDQTAHHRSRDRIEARLSFETRLEAAVCVLCTDVHGRRMMLNTPWSCTTSVYVYEI